MNRLAMSAAASALLRALIARAGVSRDRILLTEVESTDWQSLTFVGERHNFQLRVPGPDSLSIVERMCSGIEDAEFSIPGQIVADIAILGPPVSGCDRSTSIVIEALTVGE
jgi:hypothetical protein